MFHVIPAQWLGSIPIEFDYLLEASILQKTPESFQAIQANTFNLTGTSILDMGTGIGEALPMADYFSLIKQLKPTFFVTPDVLRDYDGTIQNFLEYIDEIKTLPSIPLAPAQGATSASIITCVDFYCEQFGNTPFRVGIPYRVFDGDTTVKRALSRFEMTLYLSAKYPNVEFHLLGLWHPLELALLSLENIHSCDSSYAYLMAGEGKALTSIRPEDAKITKKYDVDYNTWTQYCTRLNVVQDTFETCKTLLEGGDIWTLLKSLHI